MRLSWLLIFGRSLETLGQKIQIGRSSRPEVWTKRFYFARASRLLTLLLLSGCAAGLNQPLPQLLSNPTSEAVSDGKLQFRPQPYAALPGWEAGDHASVISAFLRSCKRLNKRQPDEPFGNNNKFGTVGNWIALCDGARAISGQNANSIRYFFETNFQAYEISNKGDPKGLFTGYYEAELRGSWQPNSRYSVPIYARPNDLIAVNLGEFRSEWTGINIAGRIDGGAFVPYPDRAAILGGALSGRQLELLWVDSHIDAFFLHIQGSGRVVIDNRDYVRLGYAGRNGRRYVAVGRELIAAGIISQEKMSMQAIRKWMEANPVAAMALMKTNPSYVFFRIMKEPNPIGAEGVQLSPGISLAVDDDHIPYGTVMWLDTLDPRDPKRETPLQRLVVAQDTGSAIKGPVRGDLFWGFGEEAAAAAGSMKEGGRYYALLPRDLAKGFSQ